MTPNHDPAPSFLIGMKISYNKECSVSKSKKLSGV